MDIHGKMRFYSCVVDSQPVFYYQAWNLVNSLIACASIPPAQILVNCTPEVDDYFIQEMNLLGCVVRTLERFGDGKYCNKIAQLSFPDLEMAECVFLLDVDMIILSSLDCLYRPGEISGKIVDFPNPGLGLLSKIFDLAGFTSHPELMPVDCTPDMTFSGNLNGGLYVIPGERVRQLHQRWSSWALFLLDNIHMLRIEGKHHHVDQVSFAMAAHELGIKIHHVDRMYNYPAHDSIENKGYPAALHYHRCMSARGLIVSTGVNDALYTSAIKDANDLITQFANCAIRDAYCQWRDWEDCQSVENVS